MPAALTEAPLAPACPDFPETRYEAATVICEGPSACQASPEALRAALLDGPVMAVNRALAFSGAVPVDVWATMDDPRFLWTDYQESLHPAAKLFSGHDVPNIWIWREILGEECGGRLYTRTPAYMEDMAEFTDDGKAPMAPTIFHALAWLLQVGVKRVRLVGCDMAGRGSPIGLEWDPIPDLAHELRWNVERGMLALSMKHYRARGARIERWKP